jgi:(p)ppGpp synthase/HD superfamily hydrolase
VKEHPIVEATILIDAVRSLARWLHRDQVDKQGVPYFAHLSRVAARVERWGGTPGQVAAAWLHDAVEDAPLSEEAIGQIFGPKIGMMVCYLTKPEVRYRPSDWTYERWIERMSSWRPARPALLVKLADLEDNLFRLDGLSAEDQARLGPRYRDARARILEALGDDAPAELRTEVAAP